MMTFLNRKKTWVRLACLVFLCQAGILIILSGLLSPIEIIDFQTTFSRENFIEMTERLGAHGIEIYLRHYWIDMFYPIFYSSFLASSLLRFGVVDRGTLFFRMLFYAPFVAGICDEIENICHISMLHAWVSVDSPAFFAGALAARYKWMLIALVLVTLVFSILRQAKTAKFSTRAR